MKEEGKCDYSHDRLIRGIHDVIKFSVNNGLEIIVKKDKNNNWRDDIEDPEATYGYLEYLDSALQKYPERMGYREYKEINHGESVTTIESKR